MKKSVQSILSFILFGFSIISYGSLKSQNIFWEDQFESLNGFGDIPPNYGGGMRVYATHGINNSKGICIQYSQFKLKDSTITPSIGPLPANATLTFDYRMVTYAGGFPSGPYLITTDTYKIFVYEASSSNTGAPRLVLNSSNHTGTGNTFNTSTIDLSAFAGQNVKIKFLGQSNGTSADYFLDMDNLQIESSTPTSIKTVKASVDFTLYPNPAFDQAVIQFAEPLSNAKLEVVNMLGASVLRKQISGSKVNLDLEELPRGVYYVKIQDNEKELIRKLILR
jgi:hypothetical protein